MNAYNCNFGNIPKENLRARARSTAFSKEISIFALTFYWLFQISALYINDAILNYTTVVVLLKNSQFEAFHPSITNRNQSIQCTANQITGFYMNATLS